MRHVNWPHKALAVTAIALALIIGTIPATVQAAPATIGVLLATVGNEPTALEIACADALLAELAEAEGIEAALLHATSPLVTARDVRLPVIDPGEDWSPLEPVLTALAAQTQLDYLAVVALMPGDEASRVQGMIVVRGGGAAQISFDNEPAADDSLAVSAARRMSRRIIEAIADGLPQPGEAGDQPVPVAADPVQPPAQPADPAADQPEPTTPAPADPAVPADQPATITDPEQPAPDTGVGEGADGPLTEAVAVFNRGEHKEALGLIRAVLGAGGADGEAYLLQARCHLALHEEEEALSALRRAVDAAPDMVEARIRLARVFGRRGLWQAAAEHYEVALELAPDDRQALLGLARLYRDNGHRQKAIDILQNTESAASDAGALMLLGDLFAANGADVDAQGAYLRAMALSDDESKAVALERLGDFYVGRHRHRDALTCYLQAAELNPTRSSVVTRRYEEVMAAADETVYGELTEAWGTFESFVRDGEGERELIFERMAICRAHVEEAVQFADSIAAPEAMQTEHARRQFAYSLAFEAAVTSLSYLDLGGDQMRDRALTRCREAIAELEGLRGTI